MAVDRSGCPGVVMVVEDDPEIRETILSVLELEGYSGLGASNGKEALDLLGENPRPCAMLVDLMMPVMSGWELVEALRSHPDYATIPVTIVSAMAHEGNVEGTRFVRKPIDLDVLLGIVHEYCDGQAATSSR